jgi:UDP-N-acetyl-D-mannosaminuronate dehydrogenase
MLVVTNDFSLIKGSDAIIIAIPLLIDEQKKYWSAPFLDTIKKIAPFISGKSSCHNRNFNPVGFSRNHVVLLLKSVVNTTEQIFYWHIARKE